MLFSETKSSRQVQEQQQRDLGRSNVASRNEQIQCDYHRYAVSHDHTYVSQDEEKLRDTNVYAQNGLELATMDVGCDEPRETTIPLEACEFSIPVEVSKDGYYVFCNESQCFILQLECQTDVK